MKLRTWLGVALCLGVSFNVVRGYQNETFQLPDLIKILKSDLSTGVSETCQKHLKEYLDGIMEQKDWALYMADSITKFPDGVLIGHTTIPGHFDECVNAVNAHFSGKHCMAKFIITRNEQNFKLPNIYYKRDTALEFFFTYGLCVPSTCNSTDIENALKMNEISFFKAYVTENDCSTSEFRPFRTEDWVTVAVIIIISIAALLSTQYDLLKRFRKNGTPNKLWSSFSVYMNWKQLFSISQSTSQLKCLHGIRFFSMCWVILGHTYFSFMFGAPINPVDMLKFMNDKSFVPVSNAFVSVDSFFFLSGLLVCLVFFRDISKKKTFDVPVAFIHRYMRLTPPFALLTLIQATIISRIGNGPFWNTRTDNVEAACRHSWWAGILYVQNYVDPTAMCLGQAWYLSADMQMYWVSPLILYPMLWFPSFAPFFLLLLVLAAAFTSFAVAFVNDLGPNLFSNWGEFTSKQFELEYSPFHTRMAPWLIGLATGYIICGIQAKKIRLNLSKPLVILGWIVGLSLLGGSLFGIVRFLPSQVPPKYSTLESAFYLSFHRVGWALGMSWVVVACVAGYGGPVNDFLSWDIFQPLGKLSYCNFLIHMTLQNYRINSSRTNQYLRHFESVYAYFGDLFISNLISIPVVLLFEFPFTNIDRYFLQKLEIFPFPRPKKEIENKEEKAEAPVRQLEDAEKGKVNPSFAESEGNEQCLDISIKLR